MAFGGGGLADVARLAFEADTGEASRDIARFERRYRDSAGQLAGHVVQECIGLRPTFSPAPI